jgi:hypothetical protein
MTKPVALIICDGWGINDRTDHNAIALAKTPHFDELKAKWGIDNLRQFMLTNFTVSEITGVRKDLKPGGEHADVTVKGAAILGPKIGNGFFSIPPRKLARFALTAWRNSS